METAETRPNYTLIVMVAAAMLTPPPDLTGSPEPEVVPALRRSDYMRVLAVKGTGFNTSTITTLVRNHAKTSTRAERFSRPSASPEEVHSVCDNDTETLGEMLEKHNRPRWQGWLGLQDS